MVLQGKEYDILQGDCAGVLKTLPADCVDMCVTSPPYWGLRQYHSGEQEIGQEDSPIEYVSKLRDVFNEVYRVLKPTGTLWLNLGDCYKDKQLLGMPWRVAFTLQDSGWILRSDIIWEKCNPLPMSVKDRCTSSHEYIFMFSKQPSGYYFDYEAIEEPAHFDVLKLQETQAEEQELFPDYIEPTTKENAVHIKFGGTKYPNGDSGADSTYSGREWKPKYKNLMADEKGQSNHSFHKRRAEGLKDEQYLVRRKRDVWSLPTHGYSGAHFATFPEKLVEPCILAGCPKHGIVLDCFNGAGTTGVVALNNNRRYLGIELNPEYVKLSHDRIAQESSQKTLDI